MASPLTAAPPSAWLTSEPLTVTGASSTTETVAVPLSLSPFVSVTVRSIGSARTSPVAPPSWSMPP